MLRVIGGAKEWIRCIFKRQSRKCRCMISPEESDRSFRVPFFFLFHLREGEFKTHPIDGDKREAEKKS